MVADENTAVAGLGHVAFMKNMLSVRKISQVSRVSLSLCRILPKNKFHPFKIYLTRELNEEEKIERRGQTFLNA